jgi:hypothetical protein
LNVDGVVGNPNRNEGFASAFGSGAGGGDASFSCTAGVARVNMNGFGGLKEKDLTSDNSGSVVFVSTTLDDSILGIRSSITGAGFAAVLKAKD